MFLKSEGPFGMGDPDSIKELCHQLLSSEPLTIPASLEDKFIAYIGDWFDMRDAHSGDLSTISNNSYCVITWEPW